MKEKLKSFVFNILKFSLLSSNKERQEEKLKEQLSKIVPDLSTQYSTHVIDMSDDYLVHKVRGQHAFQMSLALKAIDFLKEKKSINLVDIGDSSGTHLIYLNNLRDDIDINTLSVNLDPKAVDKIKAKGLNALLCRAEELHLQENGIRADIFLSYEMLEHLFSPIEFLHTMSIKSECDFFVITVPYVTKSRVALQFVKNEYEGDFAAENIHIFELSPEDWDLVFKFSGWEIVYRDKYTQYPKKFPLCLTKYLWRKLDFDGFYGVILKKNDTYSKRYLDW